MGRSESRFEHENLRPGLFAAGDMRESAPKQVVCAAGDGAVAALQAIAYADGHH
jgi:thioredoxin reductase (NADPH)